MEPSDFKTFMDVLLNRMETQELQLSQTNKLLGQVVQGLLSFQQQQSQFNQHVLGWFERQEQFNARQEQFNERQEQFNARQEQFNERQDQFNILFLDEFRDLKHDIRVLRDVTLKQYDERIQRLEDFMNGFMRKAG
jgi:chromosome segregation ATPase